MDDIDRFLSSLDMFSSPTIDAGIAQARSRELLQEHQSNILHASETLESTSRSTAANAHPPANTSLNVGIDEQNNRNYINAHSRDGEFDTTANDRVMNGEHRTARKRARCARNEHSKLENELDVSLERNAINDANGTTSNNNNNNRNSGDVSESERSKIAHSVHSKWVCNRCTLINESNAKRCEACNALRSKHGLPYVEDNNTVYNNTIELNSIGQHVEVEKEFNVECRQCHCINTLCGGKTQSCQQCGKLLEHNIMTNNKANRLLSECTNLQHEPNTSINLQSSSSCLRNTKAPVQVHVDNTHQHNTNVENVEEAANKQESGNTVITINDSDDSVGVDDDSESSSVSSDSTFSELHDEEDDSFHTPHSQSSSDKGENSNTTTTTTTTTSDDGQHHKNVHSNHEEQSDSVSNTELVHFLRNLESVSSESLPLATLPVSMRESGRLEPFQLQAVHWMLQREHRLRRRINTPPPPPPFSLSSTLPHNHFTLTSYDCYNNHNSNVSNNVEGQHSNSLYSTLAYDNTTNNNYEYHNHNGVKAEHEMEEWEKEEENNSEELLSVKGGILADYMGLGKTRSLLALCESTRGPRADRVTGSLLFSSATLIIAPTSVLSQWVGEIKKCVHPTPRILLYHGARKKKLTLFMVAQEYDYILTSYHSVRHEPAPLLHYCQATPPGKLYMIQWQRIILDEAHHIRNIRTQQCKACLRLTGICKWVVTATPVQNSVNDLFPLLKFLSVPYFGNMTWWNREIVRYLRRMPNHPRPTTALKMLFAALLLRRTPESRIGSEPILRLHDKRVVTSMVTLSPAAREIYNSIFRNATSKLGKLHEGQHFNQGSSYHTLCQFSTAFEMLLRCRQSCLHPYIAVAALRRARGLMPDSTHLLPSSSEEKEQESTLRRANNGKYENITRQHNIVSKNNNTNINSEQKETSAIKLEHRENNTTNNSINKKIREELMEKFIRRTLMGKLKEKDASYVTELMQELQNYKLGERECIICLDTVQTPVILPCAHVFCQQCITHAIELQHRCPMCKRKTQTREFLLVPDEVLLSANSVLVTLPEINVADYNNWDLELSSKTKALLDAIESIPRDEKVVVFSSFVTYLTYLQYCLEERGISCIMFTGQLSLREKDKVLQRFNTVADQEEQKNDDNSAELVNDDDDDHNQNIIMKNANRDEDDSQACKEKPCSLSTNRESPRVLLATISTCGVGITLTAANHCFLMEPTWNPAQEEQAMNRVHRIGQTKPVTITRFVTVDTVETRIDALCEQKKKLEGFIGNGQGGSASRLTMHDLLTLFMDDETHQRNSSQTTSNSRDNSSDSSEDSSDDEENSNTISSAINSQRDDRYESERINRST